MLTSCCKQATDGRTGCCGADLVQLCLLGSNCVLTWRETKYYSHASKQIIVTLLAGRWLYLSPCPDGVRRKEIRPWCCMDWMYLCAQFRCVHLTVCLPVCLSVYLPVCLPVYLLNSCLSAFSYISLSVFVLWQMFQCCRSYIRKCSRRKKILKWMRVPEHSP